MLYEYQSSPKAPKGSTEIFKAAIDIIAAKAPQNAMMHHFLELIRVPSFKTAYI